MQSSYYPIHFRLPVGRNGHSAVRGEHIMGRSNAPIAKDAWKQAAEGGCVADGLRRIRPQARGQAFIWQAADRLGAPIQAPKAAESAILRGDSRPDSYPCGGLAAQIEFQPTDFL
jgi:hypothetical protein